MIMRKGGDKGGPYRKLSPEQLRPISQGPVRSGKAKGGSHANCLEE